MLARLAGIFGLSLVWTLNACHLEHTQTCPTIGVVISTENRTLRSFTDAKQVSRFVAFANARRESSKPWYDMPAPQASVSFYYNSQFVCELGSGSYFFSVACPNWSGVRSASDAELSEFKHLIGESH
jgi:hypothetical protein